MRPINNKPNKEKKELNMADDKRAKGDKCYLCGEPSEGYYCSQCRRPVCPDHIQWKSGSRRFGYCLLDAKEFYEPVAKLCDKLIKDAKDESIDKKKYLQRAMEIMREKMG
jgi:hypothetical protein